MQTKNDSKNLWAFYPIMVVAGIVLLLAPSTVEPIMKYFHFRESMGGLLQVAYFVGGVAGIFLITRLLQRLSVKQLVVGAALLLSASLLLCSISPWYPLLLVFFVAAGFANGILIGFPGVYVTRVAGEQSHRAQNIMYSFFSAGVLAGPVIAHQVMGGDNAMWRWVFRVPALMVLPFAIPVALVTLTEITDVRTLSVATVKRVIVFNRSLFYGLFLAIVLYIAAESAVSMWLISFMEKNRHVTASAASWTLTSLWAGITLGRLVCGYMAKRIEPYRILVFLTVGAGLVLLIAPLFGSKAAAFILYPTVGFFYSGIYPFLIGYIAWFPQDLSAAVFTLFLGAGAAGGAVLPYLVGLVNQFAGRSVGMATICLPLFGVLICLYKLRPQLSQAHESGLALAHTVGGLNLDEER